MVPRVSSGTARPTTRATVNMLLTSGRPNSVAAANSASRCSGCGFMVIVVNSTLSVSVTVRVVTCSDPQADLELLEPQSGHWSRAPGRGAGPLDGLLHGLQSGHVLHGAGVALRFAVLDDVAQQPAHDLAGAGLGQRRVR